jgi:hypothetical protein
LQRHRLPLFSKHKLAAFVVPQSCKVLLHGFYHGRWPAAAGRTGGQRTRELRAERRAEQLWMQTSGFKTIGTEYIEHSSEPLARS